MEYVGFEDLTAREWNQRIIQHDSNCQKAILGLREIEEFLRDFGSLSLGRNVVLCQDYIFSLQDVSTSCALTAGSIVSCCESGCLADANTLLRKYRDDLFFYLYIIVYDSADKLLSKTPEIAQMEENIVRWIGNNLNDLYIGAVLKAIGTSPRVTDAVLKYKMKTYFDTIEIRLNNYVHSNGASFYNQRAAAYAINDLQSQMDALLKDMRSITVTFLFLLTLCSPLSIMSTDYMDCLDCDMTPPDGSQYWVAPFISEFFKNNLDLIDESCMKYLQDNTLMEF